jgi:lipoprotein-releasing system permease protein
MSYLNFIWSFLTKKGGEGKFSFSWLFPFFGVVLGTLVVGLTFAIMDGLEAEIYSKLMNFKSPAKFNISDLNLIEQSEFENYLIENNIKHYISSERNIVVSNNGDYRLVKAISIKNLHQFVDDRKLLISKDNSDYEHPIYLGADLANHRIFTNVGNSIQLISPLDINLSTGIPPTIEMNVQGIFKTNLPDFDQNFIFISHIDSKMLFKNAKTGYILLNEKIDNTLLNEIKILFPKMHYITWEEEENDLISAMRLEKISYSLFGFLIIIIAGFNLLSMMSMSVMRKIPQIGILKAIGFKNNDIKWIFIIQSLLIGIVGSIIGIILNILIIYLDKTFHFVNVLFAYFPIADFTLVGSTNKLFLMFFISNIIIIISSIYPAQKASKLHIVKSIEFNK